MGGEQRNGSFEGTPGAALELRMLRCLLAVVEEGQITRAAQRLSITQPALSRTISRLEAVAGVRLLERGRRGVSLTPEGEVFCEHARECVAEADRALSSLGPWRRPPSELVFGYDTPSLQHLVRPLIHELIELLPGTQVRMQQVGVGQRIGTVSSGELDVEIMLGPPEGEGLAFHCLDRVGRVVALPESHPLAGERELHFAQIEDEPFPGEPPGYPEAKARMWQLHELRSTPARLIDEAPRTLEELWSVVISGRAISVVPEFLGAEVAHDGVRAIPLVDAPPIEVLLARRAEDERPLVLALFAIAESHVALDPEPV